MKKWKDIKMNLLELFQKLGLDPGTEKAVDIRIEKVYYFEDQKKLEILFKGEEDVELLKKCQTGLEKKFQDHKVLWQRFQEASEETCRQYILNYIYDKEPSSCAWLRDQGLVEKDDLIEVVVPNQVLYENYSRSQYFKDLVEEVARIYKKKLSLVLAEENPDLKDYVEDLKKAESTMAKETQIHCPIPKKQPIAKSLEGGYQIGKKRSYPLMSFDEIDIYSKGFYLQGEVFELDCIEFSRNNKKSYIVKFSLTDKKTSYTAKTFFSDGKKKDEFFENVKKGSTVLIAGKLEMDSFEHGPVIKLEHLELQDKIQRQDSSEEKRIELHLHTKMSSMDGMNTAKEFIKQAAEWGHPAIAITDHAVVQSYPEAMQAAKDFDMHVIYGMEANLVDDGVLLLHGEGLYDRENPEFVVFDVETTGFSPIHDRITEIGAVKVKNGRVVDRFSQLINPLKPIPPRVVELTSISNEMVANEPSFEGVAQNFLDFTKNCIMVAHNASFDMAFMTKSFERNGYEFQRAYMDTLALAKNYILKTKNYRLGTLCKKMGISLLNAHRAVHDAEATAELFIKLMALAEKDGKKSIQDFLGAKSQQDFKKERPSHLVLLAKNKIGLKNLYLLVSKSHIETFYREPKILKSDLLEMREGLLLGSACQNSEFFEKILQGSDFDQLCQHAKFYDYLEVQPLDQYHKLIQSGMISSVEELKSLIKMIVDIGERENIPVVATGDVHYLEPEDDIFRRILIAGTYTSKRPSQIPHESLHFRTTNEMLENFSFLGEDLARKIVIENPQKIHEQIERFDPIPSGKYPPSIDGAEENLKRMTYDNAHEKYGNPLPEIIEKRLEKELNSIISNGYAVMYMIAHELVAKSNSDGYYVGSRGSVGSSLVATMSGITEVNPLPAHYVCPKCKHTEFSDNKTGGSGVDLPDKNCPHCHVPMVKEGHDIPFEVFLGFYGDKEPDIDLNFAGEYQPTAHKYVEELFGEGYVFRAGTIGTLADKTAYGFVKHFIEDREEQTPRAEINRLVSGCVGVKRTSGQHPGGIMICPKNMDIHDFTPIQYPANDKSSGRITTHFEYHAISENILKLDILGHDTPTIIKMLEDYTGFMSSEIRLDDEEVLSLFRSTEALHCDESIFQCSTGTLGIPEFGTEFVRKMLVDTKPKNFSELVRISGLSHGTDVWIGNAQSLVENNQATLSEVISTREDIMVYLMNAGADNKMAFDVMEKVRKGKGIPDKYYEKMLKLPLPKWYINSCEKIKYMFPKAHAVAYVMMSFRIAYYKINYPEAFYASYFSQKVADFNSEVCLKGAQAVQDRLDQLRFAQKETKLTTKEKNEQTVLEVALEMLSRGYKFYNVDLYQSMASNFTVKDQGILLPLQAMAGLGQAVAEQIVEQREVSEFISIEDFTNRTKASKTVVELLKENHCLDKLPDSDQLSIFTL